MSTSAFREREFEKTLNEALQPGRFIASNASFGFVQGLVPSTDRDSWHQRAMVVAEGAGLESVIDLFVKIRELDRLVARISAANATSLLAERTCGTVWSRTSAIGTGARPASCRASSV